ncbi:MAG: transketolase [Deltaproteobacteria bacterium]|nr:transketolase [Deltaproteobacteria bacterium]
MNGEQIDDKQRLDELAKEFRWVITDTICRAGSGHLGGSLSLVETIITLYFRIMNLNPQDPRWEERDRFILSKGHAGPVLYSALAYRGFFPKNWLPTLNKNGTRLPSHVDQVKTPGVDMTAGSLGQGLSCAVGMALAAKLKNKKYRVFCVVGDGESQEGQIWEAAMFAAQHKLDNLVAITDYNKMQIDGTLEEVISLEPIVEKWRAFGWEVFEMNGHDWDDIHETIRKAMDVQEKPAMIIAHTVKAKGNVCFEGQVSCHHIKVPDEDEYRRVLEGVCYFQELRLPYESKEKEPQNESS